MSCSICHILKHNFTARLPCEQRSLKSPQKSKVAREYVTDFCLQDILNSAFSRHFDLNSMCCCDHSNNTRAFTTCITTCEPSFQSHKPVTAFLSKSLRDLILFFQNRLSVFNCWSTRACSVRINFSPSTSNKRNLSFKAASKLESAALTSSEVSKLILSSRYVEKLFVSIGRIEKL